MKNLICLMTIVLGTVLLTACASTQENPEEQGTRYQKKIYLTEKDYMDDLETTAQAERREAKPNTESEYIYNVQPETQKNVYFFDYRTRPMVPGEPSELEYKKTKRLWEKPRRYSPEQYYGNQPAEDTSSSGSSSSYNSYDDYDY
ncbi:MAG: hypothetical protein IKN49_00640 [Elusimicrobiaceae bacterium]|nr:hypothetical protein [Elusimicrobiaceae bacterium]